MQGVIQKKLPKESKNGPYYSFLVGEQWYSCFDLNDGAKKCKEGDEISFEVETSGQFKNMKAVGIVREAQEVPKNATFSKSTHNTNGSRSGEIASQTAMKCAAELMSIVVAFNRVENIQAFYAKLFSMQEAIHKQILRVGAGEYNFDLATLSNEETIEDN